MKTTALTLLATVLLTPTAMAAEAGDPTAPIHQLIDSINSGDTKSALAAYAPGGISIIDEFPPHRWVGPKAPQNWAADFAKYSAAAGVTESNLNYSDPSRTEIDGKAAYVIVPTVYTYKEHGQPMAEEGQMTFVLHDGGAGWKIAAWTWSGVKPHPAK